ncbi:MAG: hypothetical protein DLM50_08650 [Candidatus Meridianibacter frigidus]|nr:MAG: hypothetical protein DLM50_08650 [Candidatus Eremiobacteraeota bacterium]
MADKVAELVELLEIEPDGLREAEFFQARAALQTRVGKTVSAAEVQDARIVLATSDGGRYIFYGFLGAEGAY